MMILTRSTTRARALAAMGGSLAVALSMTACAGSAPAAPDPGAAGPFPTSGSGELNLYNYTNYISPELLSQFTEETGITVNLDTFSSAEEMVAKVKTGAATYDVVSISDYVAEDLISSGQLQEIDAMTWPNGGNIDADFVDPYFDEGRAYTTPYSVLYNALAYNSDVVTEPVTSWKDYFSAPASAVGKIGLHDDQRFVIDGALMAVGAQPCTTDGSAYQAALDLLNDFKPNVKIISSDGTIDRLAGGETVLSTMWNGSFARAQAQNPDLVYVFPEEGFVVSTDNWGILKSAAHPDNAKIFLNWMLDPAHAAANADYIKYVPPITGAADYLTAQGQGAVVVADAEQMKRAVASEPCSVDVKEQYDKLWTMFKG